MWNVMRRERTYESVGQIIGGVVVQICARPYFAPTLSIFIDVRFGSLADKLKPARVCKARNSGAVLRDRLRRLWPHAHIAMTER